MDIIGNCLVPHQVLSAAAGRRETCGCMRSVCSRESSSVLGVCSRLYIQGAPNARRAVSNETFLHRAPIPRNPLLVPCRA